MPQVLNSQGENGNCAMGVIGLDQVTQLGDVVKKILSKHSTPNAQRRTLNVNSWTLDVGRWTLTPRIWIFR